MGKSHAEAVDTVSLSGTAEAITQMLGRFMSAIYTSFNPFQNLEDAKDRMAVRNNYFEALDKSVKPVWMAIEEHEDLYQYAEMVELEGSLALEADAVQFSLASKAGVITEGNHEKGSTTVGADCIVVTVISKGNNIGSTITCPFTGEVIVDDASSEEVTIKWEAVGVSDIPVNFTNGADFLSKMRRTVAKYRTHNPLDREFVRNVELEQEKRLAEAGF